MGRFYQFVAAAAVVALLPLSAEAQTRDISGKVTMEGTGQPIADVTVSIVGQQVGVRTNERGEYRLRVPSSEVLVLARTLGYKRQTKRLGPGENTADFVLEKDILQLEGVTVTGVATTTDRRVAATAVSSVNSQELNRVPARSVESNLAGKVAGARMFENSGAPGGGAQIQIRGATSVLAQGDPLYVVDGVIISNATISSGASSVTRASGSTGSSQDQVVNRLADLNPNDIENIEVLKSAAASAIYGSRATNGVVVITTKRGKQGRASWNVTQRVGSQSMLKNLSSRHFANLAEVSDWTGGTIGDAAAQAACGTGSCPWYDWQEQLYGRKDPSFETLLSAAGGVNNTRFFASLNDRQESGILINTGARRTGGRINLDQTLGTKWTVSAGVDVTRNYFQRGVGGNDNSGTSPIYTFGYSPAIIDLTAKDANGQYVRMPFNGGGSGTSNPFDVLNSLVNTENVWRQAGNVRANFSALSTAHNSLQLSFLAGMDRFQQEGYQYAPNRLQFEPADNFLGTANQLNASSFQFNQGANAVWTYTMGNKLLTSVTTSVGGSYENQATNVYSLRGRGLLPTVQVPLGAADIAITNNRVEFRDQSYYVNEQILGLEEKLAINAGVRADRSSANGDREKYYAFPKFSASYRFVKPLTNKIDEIKLRGAVGQSGNRPRYADRDVLYASGGLIGGNSSLVSNGLLGNPGIKPETMNETEFGTDMTFFGARLALELTRYQRRITSLLLTFPLPPSSGLGNQIINGGQLSVQGNEAVISMVPLRRGSLEWSSRVIYNANVQRTDNIPVPSFAVANSFGSTYGRNRIAANTRSTLIWGNAPLGTGGAVRDTILFDSNPVHTTTFNNDISWKRLTLSALIDWRNGGAVSNMTNNLFDEGGQARDYLIKESGRDLTGEERYKIFADGDIRPYVQSGSYVKVREITLNYQAPDSWATKIPGAKSLRFNASGRNLFMFSKYWSYDPEFNNFGNQNFNRFIDLAPFPSSRQYFFSVDLGF